MAEKLFTRKTLIQFSRYVITGLTSFGIEYLLFLALYRLVKLWYIQANSLAMMTGFIVSFFLNRLWSFQSKDNFFRQLILYNVLFALNLGISNLLMYLFSDVLRVLPLISKVMVMGLIAMWNFVIYKEIIYRR